MLLLTIAYDSGIIDIIDDISEMKEYFASKNILIGLSESKSENTHFLKLYCEADDINEKIINMFNIYVSNILYNVVVEEYCKRDLQSFIADTYFFLKYDEMKDIKEISSKSLKDEGLFMDENLVFCMNKKNAILKKIINCIEENKEINIKGFITFRMKELRKDLECIIDKIVENYMVEKEYNEFIKLLKYFVEIQESKIDEVNIIVKGNGEYLIQDENGNDILEQLFSELSEARYTGTVSVEDMLISGLITNAPQKVIIHCEENCDNKELLDTIKNVFLDRVTFCSSCKICEGIKNTLKV